MFRKMCPRSTWHVMRFHVQKVDSTHIGAYLPKSCYVCCLPYLPSPIPTTIEPPPNPSAGGEGWMGKGVGGVGKGVGMRLGR